MPPSDRPVQVAFWVPPRVQLLDLSGPVQVFQEAREHGAPFSLGYFGTSATEGVAGAIRTRRLDLLGMYRCLRTRGGRAYWMD